MFGGMKFRVVSLFKMAHNAEFCEIEDLPVYSDVTLCHYFYELGIPTPPELYAVYEKYRDLRDNIIINLPSN